MNLNRVSSVIKKKGDCRNEKTSLLWKVLFIVWKLVPINDLLDEYRFSNELNDYGEILVLLYNRTTTLVNDYIDEPWILEDESYRTSISILIKEMVSFTSSESNLFVIPSRQDTYEQVQSITTELIGVQESLELWLNTNQDQYIQQASDHMKQIKTKKEDL